MAKKPFPGHKFSGLRSTFTALCECGWESAGSLDRTEAHASFKQHLLDEHSGRKQTEPLVIDLDRVCRNCGEGLRYSVQPGSTEGEIQCGHKGDPACPASCTESLLDRAKRLYAAHQIIAQFALDFRDGCDGRPLREWMQDIERDSRKMHEACDANDIFQEVLVRVGLISARNAGRIGLIDKYTEIWNAVTARGHLERFAGEWLEAHPLPGHPPTVEDAESIINRD
jgi:hypothetical protein